MSAIRSGDSSPLCMAAKDIEEAGGRFLKGEAVVSGTGGALYRRAAVLETMEKATLSGRAFRELASQANRPVRQILRELPIHSWNFEA